MLSALGWDLGDLDDPRRAYRRKPQDDPVDYALPAFGQPLLFIEAKALGAGLGPRRCAAQAPASASMVGVAWRLLTDVDEKLFRSARVSAADQAQSCRETLLLGKERMAESA